MSRRHLTEGQKAVLANEYMRILSKKRESEAGKKANEVRWHSNISSDEITVISSDKDEVDRSRKLAAERLKVSERKISNEVRWHSNNSSDSDTLTESEKNEANPSHKKVP